jgi:hypothetical protein
VSATGFSGWEMRLGDPSSFAFRVTFLADADGTDDRATVEESASWGSFAIWAGGENLCSHVEQGQVLESVHWYVLPLLEWLADNWDPLLHEERLPLRNDGVSAAESLSRTRTPPVSLKALDEFEWLDAWADWWGRHNVRAGRDGGLFPDLYLRRYRDSLELSTGNESLPGMPSHFIFLAPNRTYVVDPVTAADIVFQVLSASVRELSRRLPKSERIARLFVKVHDLESPRRETERMAWLTGFGADIDDYARVARAVDEALGEENIRHRITDQQRATPLLAYGNAYARLLYGAISPKTELSDVVKLTKYIVKDYVPNASPWLSRLDLSLDPSEASRLTPGEQGSRLGEQACAILAADGESWINVEHVMSSLDIAISSLELSDAEVRAVSVFGPTQRPHVFRNVQTRWGTSSAVARFTLAHELCHLLFDREYGDELAIATGPWAPLAIEQRANAFAAAFLMPTWLLRDALAEATAPADDQETIRSVSAKLHVSASSLIDRLYNLGEITFDERIQLRSVAPPERDR